VLMCGKREGGRWVYEWTWVRRERRASVCVYGVCAVVSVEDVSSCAGERLWSAVNVRGWGGGRLVMTGSFLTWRVHLHTCSTVCLSATHCMYTATQLCSSRITQPNGC